MAAEMVRSLRPLCGEHCREHERLGYQRALDERCPAVVTVGPLMIDLHAQRVTVNGTDAYLTPTEWRLLTVLATRRGQIVSYSEIRDAVWGSDWYSDQAVRVNVNRIRTELGDGGRWIVTRPRYGYLLSDTPAPVRPVAQPRPPRQPRQPGWYGAPLPPGMWARDYDACRVCGTTEYRHRARGVCYRNTCLRTAGIPR